MNSATRQSVVEAGTASSCAAVLYRTLAITPPEIELQELKTWLERNAAAGVDLIQLRFQERSDREIYEFAVAARKRLPEMTMVLNRRADIATLAGLNGVHLPAYEIPTLPLRQNFPSLRLFGRSTHSIAEVDAAAEEGASYVVFGPVRSTPAKPAAKLRSEQELRQAAEAGLPVLALGGVFPDEFDRLAALGFDGVAGIRMFLNSACRDTVASAHQRFGVTAK